MPEAARRRFARPRAGTALAPLFRSHPESALRRARRGVFIRHERRVKCRHRKNDKSLMQRRFSPRLLEGFARRAGRSVRLAANHRAGRRHGVTAGEPSTRVQRQTPGAKLACSPRRALNSILQIFCRGRTKVSGKRRHALAGTRCSTPSGNWPADQMLPDRRRATRSCRDCGRFMLLEAAGAGAICCSIALPTGASSRLREFCSSGWTCRATCQICGECAGIPARPDERSDIRGAGDGSLISAARRSSAHSHRRRPPNRRAIFRAARKDETTNMAKRGSA
jgi:hypothetical protein